MPIDKTIMISKSRKNEWERTIFFRNQEEYDERLESLAIGIGRHLETLQGQISERFEQIERKYEEQLFKLQCLIEEKEREIKSKTDYYNTY